MENKRRQLLQGTAFLFSPIEGELERVFLLQYLLATYDVDAFLHLAEALSGEVVDGILSLGGSRDRIYAIDDDRPVNAEGAAIVGKGLGTIPK